MLLSSYFIHTVLNFPISAKLLVTSGIFGEISYEDLSVRYVRKNEVIDLSDPTVTCKSWIDWPIDLHGSIGGLVGEKMLICGGALNPCKIDNSQEFPKLTFNLRSFDSTREIHSEMTLYYAKTS